MPFDLARAHQRCLRLVSSRPSHPNDALPLAEVNVTVPVKNFFRRTLEIGGVHQGGSVFGHIDQGVLTLAHAAPNGYTCWHTPDQSPLALDERYLLGLTDAYRAISPDPIDWVGNWLTFPDSALPDQSEALDWFIQAGAVRLVDPEHCLLMVGWQEGRLAAHVYVMGETEKQVVVLKHNLAGEAMVFT